MPEEQPANDGWRSQPKRITVPVMFLDPERGEADITTAPNPEAIDPDRITDLMRAYVELVRVDEKLSEVIADSAKRVAEALRKCEALIVSAKNRLGLKSLPKLDDLGGTLYTVERLSVSVGKPGSPEHGAFVTWCKENGYEEQLTLYAATIVSIYKERMEQAALAAAMPPEPADTPAPAPTDGDEDGVFDAPLTWTMPPVVKVDKFETLAFRASSRK